MKFSEIERRLVGTPFIAARNARLVYNIIRENKVYNILELGIAHGAGSCYMAAALQENGGGTLTAVDLDSDKRQPSAEALVSSLGFENLVRIERMESSVTWFFHNDIREATRDGSCAPKYDLCIIDGPKSWTVDGAAYFMIDKLLRPGGWLIFDDYGWTYAEANTRRDVTDGSTYRSLSDEELTIPQIKEVFELLVKQHSSYSQFQVIDNDWAIAPKIEAEVKETIYIGRTSYRDAVGSVFSKFGRALERLLRDRRVARAKSRSRLAVSVV